MIYLDSAATSLQKPPAVARACSYAISHYASPGRGGHKPAMDAAAAAFACREAAARLFQVPKPEQVVFTNNATHGLNIAIKALVRPGGTVVISGYEHNAVTRPLHAIPDVTVRVAAGQLFRPEETVEAFRKALTPEVTAAVFTHVSNVFGMILPIQELARLCRERGVPFILDASQSAGCLPVHLEELGEKKVALFCCIPDSDRSLNYLVGMIYGQLIQTLYYVADRKYKGRLPVPVHILIDEAPNIALPTDNFLPWLSTMRSRAIFCSYIAQNMAQIKALFKEQWESLVGLCDEFLYLGGNEKETHKYVSELMGKETLDTNTYGHSRGRSGSFSVNDQQTGRELLTPDEVRMLDNRKAILFVRGERPMLDDKYDLMRHPNIRLTEDGGAAPYDYTQAKDAANDLDYSPEQYEDFELLDPEDFLKP